MCTLTTEVAVYYFFRYHEVMVNQGLSTARAVQLLQQHGPNQLEQQQGFSPVKLLLSQFLSPLIYILLFAGVLTLVAGEYVDSAIIAITVLVNASLGFFQEFKAQSALQELSKVIAPVAKVERDGKVTPIGVGEIVPGDVVHLEAGDQVPADGIILDNKDLHINEAILTGESLPVRKKAVHRVEKLSEMVSPQDDLAKHYVYMGTAVLEGKAVVKILATGKSNSGGKNCGTACHYRRTRHSFANSSSETESYISIHCHHCCSDNFCDRDVVSTTVICHAGISSGAGCLGNP